MKNKQVCETFATSNEKAKTKHLFIEGRVIYSYGYHFPLCLKVNNGFIINKNGYSQTTAQHKGILIRTITNCISFKEFEKEKQNGKYTNFILCDTTQLKKIIELNLNTLEDIKNSLIITSL